MTFDEWFLSKQGEPYDSMYVFARDAWVAAQEVEREACAKIANKQGTSSGQRIAENIRARGTNGK